jgi:cell division septation protein DedD
MPAATADAAQPDAVAASSATDDTAAIAGDTGGRELAITPAPDQPPNKATAAAAAEAQPPVAKAAPTVVATAEPAPAPKPAPPKKVVSTDNPIDLTPGKPAAQVASREPAGTAAATTASGMMVQVSSQKSEDAARATYRDLQARYKGIIGTYEPNIQRADLGDRGVYYRVRVGPFASADAQRLCDALKGAGGDCVLTAR